MGTRSTAHRTDPREELLTDTVGEDLTNCAHPAIPHTPCPFGGYSLDCPARTAPYLAVANAEPESGKAEPEPGNAEPEPAKPVQLTRREEEVLAGILAGRLNKQIADDLSISPRTVEHHRARLMRKLGAHNTAQLVRLAITRASS